MLPSFPAIPGSEFLQLHPAHATTERQTAFHLHPDQQNFVAHSIFTYSAVTRVSRSASTRASGLDVWVATLILGTLARLVT
jgi:hypothetical protein